MNMDYAPDKQKHKEAVKALINIAMIEGFVLMAVIGVYIYTGNLTYLIGGVIGSTLIFGPMFLRWVNEHGAAMRANQNLDSEGDK